MHRLILGFIAIALSITAAIAAGDGQAVGVNPSAKAGGTTLVVGADINVGDRVTTGNSGQVQILFSDQTKLVVGPSSSLLIEKYLLRGNGTADKLAVKALGGTFRFITGRSPKSAYQINTPTAAIAIRGTKFDFMVGGGQTLVMLYEGALTVCSGRSKCVDLSSRCQLAQVGGGAAKLFLRNDSARLPLASTFRYARFQTSLLSNFRISGAGNCLNIQSDQNAQSLVKDSGGYVDSGSGNQSTPTQNDPTTSTPPSTGSSFPTTTP